MQITLNMTDPRANSIALDEVIFSQAETTLTFNVSPATESLADGLSVALLTPQGGTLAHAIISASEAVLNTSTVECYEFVKGLPIEAARGAYLVVGDSTHPKAIIPVQVARNPIATIAPPTETAPIYPTSQELQSAIDRIEAALTKIEEVEDIVQGFDETVQQGIAELNTAKEAGVSAVFNAQTQAVGTLQLVTETASGLIDEAKTDALTAIGDAKTNAETALQGKVDAATESIAQSTATATNAATAAGNSATSAATSASNASTSATAASNSATAASNSATAAAKSAADTLAIKTELANALTEASGVADRVTAVETEVSAIEEDKSDKLSPVFRSVFDISQEATIAESGLKVAYPCHNGWLARIAYYSESRDWDYYISNDGTVVKTSQSIFGTPRLLIIKSDETVLYATNRSSKKLKVTIKDKIVTIEELDSFPANVGAYSWGYGILDETGFVVTTEGVILDGETLAEVSTFYDVGYSDNHLAPKIKKVGEAYLFADTTQRKLCRMTLDSAGTPTITVNGYTQPTDREFYPFLADWGAVCVNGVVAYKGFTAANIGYNYAAEAGIIGVTTALLGFFKMGNLAVVVDKNNFWCAISRNNLLNLGENVFYSRLVQTGYQLSTANDYAPFKIIEDAQGAVLVAMFTIYHWGANQWFRILTRK